ncbi:hypothetical protein COV19_02530 [Candidatus Woesearchaeota archaeon CG10_big_fil_rev_8_21_14_0_10_44_13]|nr:MAG: hypothetical protein COV19_02530 [Candidatus Woesearchaeota archaeon CG10_big_fil_rev_8_21_14_0_10_44_13]
MINKTRIGDIEIGGESRFFRFEEKDDFRMAFALAYDEHNPKIIEENDVDAVAITIRSDNPEEAIKQVEDFRSRCKKPLIIYTQDNPNTDHIIIDAIARRFPGQHFLFCSATVKNKAADIANSALKFGHNVSAYTTLDPGGAISLNKDLLKTGLKPKQIVIDPLTSFIGYGIEYSISAMERIRLDALATDETLRMPILADLSAVNQLREADTKEKQLHWETMTAVALIAAGADLFIFRHIESLRKVKGFAEKMKKR